MSAFRAKIFMATAFTDANFNEEVLNFSGVVLVDFFAPWCGPCKMLGPIIDELEAEIGSENIKIGKVDVDQSPETAQKYNVMSVPTVIIFQDGEIVEQMAGVQSKEALREKLENRKQKAENRV